MKHRILVAGAAFALLSLIASNPALARQSADKDSWWQCDQSFTIKPDGFHSVLVRFVSTDGKLLREEHHLQGNGLRANWAHHPKDFPFSFSDSLLWIDIDPRKTIGTQGIWAFLFADGKLLTSARILGAKGAKRGTTSSTVFFSGDEQLAKLGQSDRWTLVIVRDDGTEIERRDLVIPDRAVRERSITKHRAELDAAWVRRDERPSLLTPRPESEIGWCVLSTPGRRREEALSEI